MSMQNGELARSTQRLIEMLRPEKVGTAAQTAMTWFKPLPISSNVIKPIRLPEFPATLGRIGSLEVRLA
ncbi:MAG TPA: ornithine--acyl-ACP N-acyltransferase OlsB, partial [Bradyrhizobium sp.]|nr:ornithine--acyl-ACP N-acyltransferase OlsB [Bradyrhizobium sp.]